jgi:flagellar basal body-associated protein FliL
VEAAKFSNLLLKIRREVIAQRKEAERQAQKEAKERAELIMTVFAILLIIVAAISGAGAWLLRSNKGDIDLNFTMFTPITTIPI